MTFPIGVCVLVTQSCLILCDPVNCVAHQAALSMDFSRKEYWSGLPCPSPGDLPDSRIEPGSPALQVDSLLSKPPGKSLAGGVVRVKWMYVHATSLQSCLTLRPHGLQPPRLLCPQDSPGKNIGVGCHALLQGIFLTLRSNPQLLLLHWQTGSLPTINNF